MASRWTQKEIQQLLTNEGLISIEKLAKDLNRTEAAIISKFLKEKSVAEPCILFKMNGVLTDSATVSLSQNTVDIYGFLINMEEPSIFIAWSLLMGKNLADIILSYPDDTSTYSVVRLVLNEPGLVKLNAKVGTTSKIFNLTITE